MDCDTAGGLMPWLLNRTLAPGEADAVRRHLEGCARCRAERDETKQAAAVFGAHPPTADIVDLAWERPLADAGLVRRHVAECAECAEELQLAEESRRASMPAADGTRVAAFPSRRRWLALPATLAAGLVLGLLWPRPPAPKDDGRVAVLEAELRRLQSSVADLQSRAAALAAPDLNLPVFELVASALTRGAGGAANEIVVPSGARQVALLLVAEGDGDAPARLEVRRADGTVVWQADGLRANPLGAYTLAVPASSLGAGSYVFALSRAGGPTVEYRVRVSATASSSSGAPSSGRR